MVGIDYKKRSSGKKLNFTEFIDKTVSERSMGMGMIDYKKRSPKKEISFGDFLEEVVPVISFFILFYFLAIVLFSV